MRTPGILACLLTLVALPTAASDPDPPPVLLSRQLVEARGLEVGQVVRLSPSPDGSSASPFRIAGVYEPVADPMKLTATRHEARLHLPHLLALTARPDDPQATETVRAINVALRDPESAAAWGGELVRRAPGLIAAPTRPAEAGTPFVVLERFHQAIAAVTVLAGTAFLLALMIMRADERRETAGILRLLGLGRRRVLVGVLAEGLVVAVGGALFGVAFALATEGAFNAFFQWRYDTALVFVRVTPSIALRCVAVAVPLGIAAGLAASWTLLRRETVELLRR